MNNKAEAFKEQLQKTMELPAHIEIKVNMVADLCAEVAREAVERLIGDMPDSMFESCLREAIKEIDKAFGVSDEKV